MYGEVPSLFIGFNLNTVDKSRRKIGTLGHKDHKRRAASRSLANRAFSGHCESSLRLVAISRRPRSVLLLLVESLSRVNARVQLPRTVAVLRDLYNSTFLNGEQLIEVICYKYKALKCSEMPLGTLPRPGEGGGQHLPQPAHAAHRPLCWREGRQRRRDGEVTT